MGIEQFIIILDVPWVEYNLALADKQRHQVYMGDPRTKGYTKACTFNKVAAASMFECLVGLKIWTTTTIPSYKSKQCSANTQHRNNVISK